MQNMMDEIKILIVAGEASGDILGGHLIRALKERFPDQELLPWGIGGEIMASSGVDLMFSVDDLGVTGFSEVIWKFRHILKVFRTVVTRAKNSQPDIAVLIDYPDFNLRLAKRLKTLKIPVVYYVSPQMWAWRSGRVNLVKKTITKMMVLFPFEETWYRQRGAVAEFVGHPVIDRVRAVPDKAFCRQLLGVKDDEFVIAMLPGSRKNEVNRTLPVLLEAREKLLTQTKGKLPDGRTLKFIMPLSSTMPEHRLPVDLQTLRFKIETVHGNTLKVLKSADFAWVTSGTASLETALLHTPQIVVYKTSPITYFLAKLLVNIKYISIANLVVDSPVALELIQNDFNPQRIVQETNKIIENNDLLKKNKEQLEKLDTLFGQTGASRRAADAVATVLLNSSHSAGGRSH